MHTTTSTPGILTFMGLLTLFLAALRYAGFEIPWLWVFSPMWLAVASIFVLLLIVAIRYYVEKFICPPAEARTVVLERRRKIPVPY